MPGKKIASEPKELNKGMTTHRIQGLTDGIFAVAMTLLILNIEVPAVRDQITLTNRLLDLQLLFFDYVLSFLLLASFWAAHHRQYHVIRRVDDRLVWINVVFLVFVVLVPFSTSLFGDNRNLQIAAVFFETNLLVLGLTMYWQWSYVTGHPDFVQPDVDKESIEIGKKINLVIPLVSLAAIAVSFISPDWSSTIYISIPFIIARLRRRTRSGKSKFANS